MKIVLDARMQSSLDWTEQLERARDADTIDWDLNLGLFQELPRPLEDFAQLQSLQLALDYFIEKVWRPFEKQTRAVFLFRGELTQEFPSHFFQGLTERVIDEVPFAIEVATGKIRSLLDKALLLAPERFGGIQLHHDAPFSARASVGVLLPPQGSSKPDGLEAFLLQNSVVRLVSGSRLTLDWQGLDVLYCFHPLDPLVLRKVQGFIAAGGDYRSSICDA